MTVTQCYPMSTSRALKRLTHGGVSIYDMFSKHAEAAGIFSYLLRQYFKKKKIFCFVTFTPTFLPWLSSVTKWFGLSLQWPQQNFHWEQLHVAKYGSVKQHGHINHFWHQLDVGFLSWIRAHHTQRVATFAPHLDTMAADRCPCLLIVKKKKKNLDQLQHQARVAASDTWK